MTMQSIGLLAWPERLINPSVNSSAMSNSTLTFDSTADRIAYVGQAPIADSISKVFFRTGTVTTGDTVKVQIESVLNGRPNGIIAAGASGTVAIADTDDNVWKSVTIGTPYTFATGEEFAIVITHGSGATPNWLLSAAPSDIAGFSSGMYPILLQDTGGGTWAAASAGAFHMLAEFTNAAGAVTLPGLLPQNGPSNTITSGFNSGSNPNERGMKFVPPVKMRVVGAAVGIFNVAAGADFKVYLYDAEDNPASGAAVILAESNTLDGDFPLSTTRDGLVNVFFPTPVTLSAGVTYHLCVKPITANSISVSQLDAGGTGASATGIRAFGLGNNVVCQATRQWVGSDPGAWTYTTDRLPVMSLLIDQLDDGASTGGGLLTHPGMSGGMRG